MKWFVPQTMDHPTERPFVREHWKSADKDAVVYINNTWKWSSHFKNGAVFLARVMKHLRGNQMRFLLTLSTLRCLSHHIEQWSMDIRFLSLCSLPRISSKITRRSSVSRHMRCGISEFSSHISTNLTPLHCPWIRNYIAITTAAYQSSASGRRLQLRNGLFVLFLFAIKSLFTLVIITAFMCLRRQNWTISTSRCLCCHRSSSPMRCWWQALVEER